VQSRCDALCIICLLHESKGARFRTTIENDEFARNIQDESRIRPQNLPGDDWRWQEDFGYSEKQTIFAQDDSADAVSYIQKGKVRLTVVSKIGKEATIASVSERNFFGEGALAGQLLRMGSAAAMTDCELLRVEKWTADATVVPVEFE